MASFNRVVLLGNLTRDPELKSLPSGVEVCEFGMALNRKYKTKDGESKEEVAFVDVAAWGATGENVNKYMEKGSLVLVEGRLKYDKWEKDGEKRSKLSVTADNVQFMPKGTGTGGSDSGSSGSSDDAPF